MKQSKINILFVLLITVALSSCDESEEILLTGDIKVSEIENKTDYLAPIILEKDINDKIILNNIEFEFTQGIHELADAGFYEMIIGNKETILFVLLDAERGQPEWGLRKWIPEEPVIQNNFNGNIEIIHPKMYCQNIAIPFVFKVENWSVESTTNLNCVVTDGNSFLLKRGIGSVTSSFSESGVIQFTVGSETDNLTLEQNSSDEFELEEEVQTNLEFESNSIIHLKSDLVINATGSLTFKEGCILIIDEGKNISNFGSINFAGTKSNPILVTCSEKDKFFGGFISEGDKAEIKGEYAFFTQFAYHSSSDYQYGHAKRQALFKSENTQLAFTNCYFLETPGQVFYPESCSLTINDCFVQRAKTSGQINNSTLIINNSCFSDFPDDSQNYRDQDNDALYINATDAEISNSIFMYAKDDGIDSGGGGGGTVTINNCRFDACFHEGLALSSSEPSVKSHTIKNSVITNCQQGIELGFSSSNHKVVIDDCQINNNYIGVRYGDNYAWGGRGIMNIKNSTIKDNTKNIWNMVHQIWAPKTDNLTIEESTEF